MWRSAISRSSCGRIPSLVIPHDEHWPTTATPALDHDRASVGIDRILHELGDRLPRLALAASEPANQIERVCRLAGSRFDRRVDTGEDALRARAMAKAWQKSRVAPSISDEDGGQTRIAETFSPRE